MKTRWEVPSTIFWYVAGSQYIGTLVIRHHAARMLAEGLDQCRRLGLSRVLLTCSPEHDASKRVILANGGRYEDRRRGDDRYWIDLRDGR